MYRDNTEGLQESTGPLDEINVPRLEESVAGELVHSTQGLVLCPRNWTRPSGVELGTRMIGVP